MCVRVRVCVRACVCVCVDSANSLMHYYTYYDVAVTIDTPLPADLPLPCTIRHLVTYYLDIQCVPRRYFFELLLSFTTSQMEKERLTEFCSADGQVSH